MSIFSRVGIPEEILSDQGTQFTSKLMKEVGRLLSMKQLATTPYHPQCNGLVERFNGTLKTMLKRMCAERPKDWDRYIDALLFAYREAPQESLGFAPFELLYGRSVNGPLQILRQLWTKEQTDPETRSTYQYVVDLRNRLQETWVNCAGTSHSRSVILISVDEREHSSEVTKSSFCCRQATTNSSCNGESHSKFWIALKDMIS